MDSFGKRLKQLRLNIQLTQEQLGKVFNVTNVGVAKWESDNRFPDKNTLIKIADYFNVSIDYLLCRTDNLIEKTYNYNRIEINKNYSHNLTPTEVEILINRLKEIGFDINKLIEEAKNKND